MKQVTAAATSTKLIWSSRSRRNAMKNAHGYSFTATCKTSSGGTMVTRGSETIQDSQHIVSESHTVMTRNGKARDGVEIHEHLPGRRLRQDKTRWARI